MSWIHDPNVPCNAIQTLTDVFQIAITDSNFMPGHASYTTAQRALSCAAAPSGANGHTLQEQCDLAAQARTDAGVGDWFGAITALEDAGGGLARGGEIIGGGELEEEGDMDQASPS